VSIRNHSFETTKTAHYSTHGILSKKTKYIWFALHGYGQLSKRMVNKFDFLDPEEHFVIVPEGLNRFYWHANNEPVACWMTKEDRYDEIEDFTRYLQNVYDRHCSHVNREVKIIFLGFSQGCATMWRWIHAKKPHYNIAINWAGWIPEDIHYRHMSEYLEGKKHYLLYGDQDKFIDEKAIQGIQEVIDESNLNIEISQFKGGHKIVKEELEKFAVEKIKVE